MQQRVVRGGVVLAMLMETHIIWIIALSEDTILIISFFLVDIFIFNSHISNAEQKLRVEFIYFNRKVVGKKRAVEVQKAGINRYVQIGDFQQERIVGFHFLLWELRSTKFDESIIKYMRHVAIVRGLCNSL